MKPLSQIQKEIFRSQILLIIVLAVLITVTGLSLNIYYESRRLDQNLQNVAETIAHSQIIWDELHGETMEEESVMTFYLDSLKKSLSNIDVISVIGTNQVRFYHSNSELIGTVYDGTIPAFVRDEKEFYAGNDNGPSGRQRRAYAAIYDENGEYLGFVLAVMLQENIVKITIHTIILYSLAAMLVIFAAVFTSYKLSKKINRQMEDLTGVRYLVDSMRANNHDFTNKLHVILGLIQMQKYDEATSYIMNITMVQQKTISLIMRSVDDPSVAALLIGKHARACELDIRFTLKSGSCFKKKDVRIPSGSLVTIIGNLLDNAMDSMNEKSEPPKELSIGIFTSQEAMLISVDDTGGGMTKEVQEHMFENGFSTKGEERGTGLYVIKNLIESYGGSITVDSELDVGTSFLISFQK